MGNCIEICGEQDYEDRHFRAVPFQTSSDPNQAPTFHHPQFRQTQDGVEFRQTQNQQQQQQQQQRFAVGAAGGGGRNAGGGMMMMGEATRNHAQFEARVQDTTPQFASPNPQQQQGGGTSSIRRAPSQTPQQQQQQQHNKNNIAPIHDDARTVVYRQGNNEKSTLIKTPRSALSGRSTGRGGATTPRNATGRSSGGGGTPRPGQQQQNTNNSVANDPFNNNEDDDDQSEGANPDEMVLVCADCFEDVMADGVAKCCPVTGKLHI